MTNPLVGAAAVAAALIVTLGSPSGATPSTLTGTIDVAGAGDGDRSAAVALAYGDSASFTTSVQGRLDPKGELLVRVLCWQGGSVVYQWSADPAFAFPLVDQAGQGLEWDGGAASCTGELIYRIAGRRTVLQTLDQVGFEVAAA